MKSHAMYIIYIYIVTSYWFKNIYSLQKHTYRQLLMLKLKVEIRKVKKNQIIFSFLFSPIVFSFPSSTPLTRAKTLCSIVHHFLVPGVYGRDAGVLPQLSYHGADFGQFVGVIQRTQVHVARVSFTEGQ